MNTERIVDFLLQKHINIEENRARDIYLYYVLDGTVELCINKQVYVMGAEDLVVINSGQNFSVTGQGSLIVVLTINSIFLLRMMNNEKKFFSCNSVQEKNDNFIQLRKLVQQMINTQFEDGYKALQYQKHSYELLLFLVDNFSNNIIFETREQKLLDDIRTYIDVNYRSDISLDSIASYFGYTPQYFSSFFKKTFQTTFLKYVNQMRLNFAYDNLMNTDETILKIAMDSGFPNVTSFSAAFRKVYTEAPATYREKFRVYDKKEDENINLEQVNELLSLTDDRAPGNMLCIDGGKREQLNPYWNTLWNLGTFSQLTDSEIKEQVRSLKEVLDFPCVRVILDMYDKQKEHALLFYEEEKVFDFLIDLRVDIMIVIEYRAYSRSEEFPVYLEAMLYNFINRYGAKMVQQWRFELFYDSDFHKEKGKYYRVFYNKIQAVLDKIGVVKDIVGPGLLPDKKGENIIRFLKANPQIQMLTLSAAPYSIERDADNIFLSKNTDMNYLRNQIELVRDLLHICENNVRSVYVVRWSDSLTEPNIMYDTCYSAARIMQTIINCYFCNVDGLAWSVPLDLLAKTPAKNTILTGGPGLLNRKGMRKPIFYAYAFLKKLDQHFVQRDQYSMVTCDNERYYEIVCHNCKKLNYKYYTKEENRLSYSELNDYFEDVEQRRTEVQINSIPNGRYLIKFRSITDCSGILSAWEQMGYFQNNLLGPDELDFLRHKSVPVITTKMIQVDDKLMRFTFDMAANEIKHIHIIYMY